MKILGTLPTHDETLTALHDMRKLIAQGWAQGSNYQTADGVVCGRSEMKRCCLRGAVAYVTNQDGPRAGAGAGAGAGVFKPYLYSRLSSEMYEALRLSGFVSHNYTEFNDQAGRKVEDILVLIDVAINHVHALREGEETPT